MSKSRAGSSARWVCQRKATYPTEQAALANAHMDTWRRARHAYQCSWCGLWHLTSKAITEIAETENQA